MKFFLSPVIWKAQKKQTKFMNFTSRINDKNDFIKY